MNCVTSYLLLLLPSLYDITFLRGVVKRVGVFVRERSVINHNDSLWHGALTKGTAQAAFDELAACKTLGCESRLHPCAKSPQRECARPIVVAKSILERSRASGAAVEVRKAQIAECC